MNLLKSKHWVAIALGLLSGPALAATITCTITPVNTIITEGQTLQLAANCENAVLTSINWSMNAIGDGLNAKSVTGNVTLSNHAAGEPILYTTPVGLSSAGSGDYRFTVTGASSGNTIVSTEAQVIVQPTSAVLARASGSSTPTTPINAVCGTANGISVQTMPTGTAQCNPGKPTLAISGPGSFTWSCLSLNGGAEANCYALRGTMYTVTASVSGGNGTVSPASQSVNGGQSATVTVTPALNYFADVNSTCGGNLSGTTFTTGSVNAPCTVTASFSGQPAAVNGVCGSSNNGTFSTAPSTNLCSAGTNTSVITNTTTYNWSCNGSNGGTNVSCSATRTTTPPPSGGSDPGTGAWWASANRLIADQSGTEAYIKTSYVPGCLNGDNSVNSSSGCAANATYNDSFAFGSGKVLGLRYTAKPNAGSSVKYFRLFSGDGGQVGQSMKVWLSSNPTASYDETSTVCKTTSTTNPIVLTGGSYCPITAGGRYYLLMSVDATAPNPPTWRYKVDETASDFD